MKLFTLLIQLFVVSLIFTRNVSAQQAGSPTIASNGISSASVKTQPKFIAYYFHRNRRCVTCRAIEANAETAISENFAKEIASGSLEWRVANIDQPENQHFISDFNLYSSALVLVDTSGSSVRFTNMEKVWPLSHNEAAFAPYVIEGVRKFMEAPNG